MRINRRKVMGLLAATAATSQVASSQPPQQQPRNADAELDAARQGRLRDAQRVAAVKLPQTTEPAFRFRA